MNRTGRRLAGSLAIALLLAGCAPGSASTLRGGMLAGSIKE